MMQANLAKHDPVSGRQRSQSPIGRKTRSSTLKAAGTVAEAFEKARRKHHDSHTQDDYRPQMQSDSNFKANDAYANLRIQLSDANYDTDVLRTENEKRKEENRKLKVQNQELMKEKQSLNDMVGIYHRELSHSKSECDGLTRRLQNVDQHVASISRGTSWFGIIPGFRDTRIPENNLIIELRANLARHEHQAAVYNQQISDHWRQATGWEQQADGYRQQAARQEQQIAENKHQIDRLEAENRKLRAKALEHEKQMHAQTSAFARELDTITSKDLLKVPNVSDTEIQGKWKSLCFLVRQFVSVHLPGSLDPSTAQDASEAGIFRELPQVARILQTPLLCPIVLESWIWHFLCFRIFDSESEFWAGKFGQKFNFLCNDIRDCIVDHPESLNSPTTVVTQLHDWRVRSTHFLSQLGAHDKANAIKEQAERMIRGLKHFDPTLSHKHRDIRAVQEDIVEIIRMASELDAIFRASRADFHVFITRLKLPLVEPPELGFKFDRQTMECIKEVSSFGQGSAAPTVDLAVSPGIFKAGNSDGANYSSERVLVKLQALCNLRDTLEFFGGGDRGTQQTGHGHETKVKRDDMVIDDDVDML